MAKSPEEMMASMVANMEENTGKSLTTWVSLAKAAGLEKHGQIIAHLKSEYGLGHGFANLVAHTVLNEGKDSGEHDLLTAQYAGKAELLAIYTKLAERVAALGPDVTLSIKKTCVSFRRNKQFGLVQPTTKTRLDVGINLKDVPPGPRLEASGSFNAMVSHRVKVSDPNDVNDELMGWLQEAYHRA